MTLSDASIKNPVFAWMLMIGLIVFGWIENMTADNGLIRDVVHCGASDQTRAFSWIAAHELFEAMSDTNLGWFDGLASGEISDKCEDLLPTACVTMVSNGSVASTRSTPASPTGDSSV